MNDQEKIKAAISMLKQLKRMVGFFMKREISELIEKLEKDNDIHSGSKQNNKSFPSNFI